jgi:hypothetical protein
MLTAGYYPRSGFKDPRTRAKAAKWNTSTILKPKGRGSVEDVDRLVDHVQAGEENLKEGIICFKSKFEGFYTHVNTLGDQRRYAQ